MGVLLLTETDVLGSRRHAVGVISRAWMLRGLGLFPPPRDRSTLENPSVLSCRVRNKCVICFKGALGCRRNVARVVRRPWRFGRPFRFPAASNGGAFNQLRGHMVIVGIVIRARSVFWWRVLPAPSDGESTAFVPASDFIKLKKNHPCI